MKKTIALALGAFLLAGASAAQDFVPGKAVSRSEEHTSELQSH